MRLRRGARAARAAALLAALGAADAVPAGAQEAREADAGAQGDGGGAPAGGLRESDIFLGGEALGEDEAENLGKIYKWLDDIFWTGLWDSREGREAAYAQLQQLADLATAHFPSIVFGVGQAFYSYFWFADNGGELNMDAAMRSVALHELSLRQSGCDNLTMPVGSFLKSACQDRWLYLIMLCAEVGLEAAARRADAAGAARLLQRADGLFREVEPYAFFGFRGWSSIYDVNTNSHVFPEHVRQRPVWPRGAIPLAEWFEAHAHVFRDDLDRILRDDLFDELYFKGRVSMTQFSGRRESWAPLNLIHNRELAPHACEVANRSCELLLTRPEIARCDAKDVGAAFARLAPGMGIKPHFWTAPPRLGVHLGLRVPPGASMAVGNRTVVWRDGEAVVFDDTYIHSVRHQGAETRYLLIAWFCHPCDPVHAEVPAEDPMGMCAP